MNNDFQHFFETLARWGYFTKGVLYLLIGVLSAQTVFTLESAKGGKDVVRTLAEQPFGHFILLALLGGLAAYAAWRLIEAILGWKHDRKDAGGILQRLAGAGRALIYAGFAFWIAQLLFDSAAQGHSERDWAARLLSYPGGRWMMGAIGVICIVAAAHYFLQTWKGRFMKKYRQGRDRKQDQPRGIYRKLLKAIGQYGQGARAVIFLIIGVSVVFGALHTNPNEAIGLDEALEKLYEWPFGSWIMIFVASGLIAYGFYCFSLAAHADFIKE